MADTPTYRRADTIRNELYECLRWFGAQPKAEGAVPDIHQGIDTLNEFATRIDQALHKKEAESVPLTKTKGAVPPPRAGMARLEMSLTIDGATVSTVYDVDRMLMGVVRMPRIVEGLYDDLVQKHVERVAGLREGQ